MNQIIVIGPKDEVPTGYNVINTTSRSTNWSQGLSPFLLGPVQLYDKFWAKNVENGWQYSKVYPEHVGTDRMLNDQYWKWAVGGWMNNRAVRYPMGKGAKPLFSTWNGFRLDYISARKYIYIPIYSRVVVESDAFNWLRFLIQDGQKLALWDFDGYNHHKLGMSYEDVINDPKRKMGHAFVIAMLLQGKFDISQGPLWHFYYMEDSKCYH